MAGIRKDKVSSGKFRGWYMDWTRKRVFFTGTRNRTETLKMARNLEVEHQLFRLGRGPDPNHLDKKHARLSFGEITSDYMQWGESQGGRGGKPWGKTHARNRRAHLAWWKKQLKLNNLADLNGILPQVEEALRELQNKGRTGKTLTNYAEALAAFCDWCVKRGYLSDDPLKALARFDTTPVSKRRAMTVDEINRLLEVSDTHQRLLYETAFLSGLRANELRNLTVDHLDVEQGGLRLDAEWTKDRKGGFQWLPRMLVGSLRDFAEAEGAKQLYARSNSRKDTSNRPPKNPLLYVPSHPARELDKDLEAAGIPKNAPGGKLDFHACRVAYINLVLESANVSVKEAQTLARHATPDMTINVYGRARDERLSEIVENVAENLLLDQSRAPVVHRQVAGAEYEQCATPVETGGCASSKNWWRRRELNPRPKMVLP